MEKLNYLNVGCGKKFNAKWVNVDMVSNSKDVIAANLIKGFPFNDNQFDVVYHSQVLEHIPKDQAARFIKECYRVLKPGGILRVVVPDLENIVNEYSRLLKENIENPSEIAAANYDWILLEMYDQTVRNQNGGDMAAYLKSEKLVNEQYVYDRIGYVGKSIRTQYLNNDKTPLLHSIKKAFSSLNMFKYAVRLVMHKLKLQSQATRVGQFRLGGEIHMWMYDRYSLSKLLSACGFEDVSQKNPFSSNIPDWDSYELDVKNGLAYDPTSLFMEATKKTRQV